MLTAFPHTFHLPPVSDLSAIRPSELVGEAWTKKDKDTLSPHVLAMINRSTMVTNWVVRSIIECSDVHERAEAFAMFCEVCQGKGGGGR